MIKESWEAESSTENREAADHLVVSLEEISKGGNDSDDWRITLA
jgi:hypothetical protein